MTQVVEGFLYGSMAMEPEFHLLPRPAEDELRDGYIHPADGMDAHYPNLSSLLASFSGKRVRVVIETLS